MRTKTLDKYGIPVFIALSLIGGLIGGLTWSESLRLEAANAPHGCTHTTIDKYLPCK